jgi:hypothetical protein
MDCRRAEELFSDHLAGTLSAESRDALEDHLRQCGACRLLRAAFGEVVAALQALPIVEAPPGLSERAASAARRAPAPDARPRATSTRMPPWLQVAAAALALLVTGVVAAASRAWTPAQLGPRWAERTAIAGGYLAERRERLVEDVRLLRVVVETVFEERFDRVGDRIEDYRRLLARRRALEQRQQQRRGQPSPAPESKREFSNPTSADGVPQCETDARAQQPAWPACHLPPHARPPRRADRREGARS